MRLTSCVPVPGFALIPFFGKLFAHAFGRSFALVCGLTVWLLSAASPTLAGPEWRVPTEVSQGRAFVVSIYHQEEFDVSLRWQGKDVPMPVRQPEGQALWRAETLLGMPMDAKGSQDLKLVLDGEEYLLSVAARQVPWKEQHITVEPKYVAPPKEEMDRIARETEKNRKLLAAMEPATEWSLPFYRPVKGTVSSSFGGRRVFNGEPRSPHKGTDLRGASGTPIRAAAAGQVVLAENQYFSGNVVYIDHGQGILSLYAHMSAFDVKVGDRVEQGQIIGKVGATGRVTGPHLHLGLMIQGVAVDAMPLFDAPLQLVGGPTEEVPSAPRQ